MMRVVEPRQFPIRRRLFSWKRFFVRAILVCFLLTLLGGGVGVLYMRPLPLVQPVASAQPDSATSPVALSWPSYGQAAIGSPGYGVLATNGVQKAVPTASVAKLFTALAVLKQHPLEPKQDGPILTISQVDMETYDTYIAKQGSVLPVALGDQLSQYQALQALLIPSANNIADMLARWAFGSIEEYVTFANSYALSLGLKDTHIADASGFSELTVSTAQDLVRLGELALANPVIAQIVDQSQATLPGAGVIYSTNPIITRNDIVGIKTGNTDEAGGCYVVAKKHDVGQGNVVTIIVAVMAAPNLATAVKNAQALADTATTGFALRTFVPAGAVLGKYQMPWGKTTPAEAKTDLVGVVWKTAPVQVVTTLQPLRAPQNQGSEVGTVSVQIGLSLKTVPVVLRQSIVEPPPSWRLLRYVSR